MKLSAKTKISMIKWLLVIIVLLIGGFYYYVNKTEYQKQIQIEDVKVFENEIQLTLSDEGYCQYTRDVVPVGEWIPSKNKICKLPFIEGKVTLIAVNEYQNSPVTIEDQEFGFVKQVEILSDTIYLAIGGTKEVDYKVDYKGHVDGNIEFYIEDKEIASLDNKQIKGLKKGETNLVLKLGDKEDNVKIYVTDMIVVMPDEFDTSRSFLPCDIYSKEDNDFLDAILESRVNEAGYKTRAGAVAAARFLGLEFPYRINYFTENGRMGSCYGRKIDGEGRYYHKGLFLHESRFENLEKGASMAGPATWGCKINEYSWNRVAANGLDCSGSISWVIHQAGFDPGDIGAGITPDCKSLADLGERKSLKEAIANKTLKVGDLLSGGDGWVSSHGGHIALIAGLTDDAMYVAEELGYTWGWGFYITKYSYTEILNHFYWQVDMDEYYKEDGNLTNYWK